MPSGVFEVGANLTDFEYEYQDDSSVVDTSSTRTVEDAARELEMAMDRATAQRKTVRASPSLDETDERGHCVVETLTVRKDIKDGSVSHSRTTVLQMDHDEQKYKRRSPLELLSRWLGLRWGKKRSNTSQSKHKRYVIIILLLVLAALTFIVLLSYTSQWTSEDDLAFLDPMNNPNIRVGHG